MPKRKVPPSEIISAANSRRELNRARAERDHQPTNLQLIPRPRRIKLPPAPTPWVFLTVASTQLQYRCCLLIKRKNGALHLEIHPQSPTAPGVVAFMHPSRPGYFDFIRAGHALLRAAMWSPLHEPGTRTMWNDGSTEFSQREGHWDTVSRYVDRLLNPRRGRPLTHQRMTELEIRMAASNPLSGLRTGYKAARAKRRNEMLAGAQKLKNTLIDMRTPFDNARSMVGYTKAEQMMLVQQLVEIRRHVDALWTLVFTEQQPGAPEHTTAGMDNLPRHRQNQPMDGEFDDVAAMIKDVVPVGQSEVVRVGDRDESHE